MSLIGASLELVGRFAAVASVALSLSIGASCSHGNYDGSGGSDGADAGNASIVRIVGASKTSVTSSDGVLTVTIGAATFPEGTPLTIAAGADRTLENGLVVPTYTVTAPSPPKLPVLVTFSGNANGNGNQQAVAVGIQHPDLTFAPLPFAGAQVQGVGGNVFPYWGATTALGTFSLLTVDVGTTRTITDLKPTGCPAKCCTPNGNANSSASATAGGCYCGNVGPDLDCVLANCPDIEAAGKRCQDLAASAAASIDCKQLGCTNCGNNTCNVGSQGGPSQICCAQRGGGGGTANICTSTGQGCSGGIAVHCTASDQCGTGRVCCVNGDETICTETCTPENRVCTSTSDCPTCQTNAICPFMTCGAPPAACR